jgi:PPOX class probable F420-dependent enzyme
MPRCNPELQPAASLSAQGHSGWRPPLPGSLSTLMPRGACPTTGGQSEVRHTGQVDVAVPRKQGSSERPGLLPIAGQGPVAGRPGSVVAAFDEATRNLLDGRNFATVATLNPDGGPQTSVVWIVREGDTVAFSTTAARRKVLNLARDPRISVTVFDTGNPYHSVEIRGTAELVEDTGKSLPKILSHKYLGEDPPPEPDEVIRLIVRVRPERINVFSV